MVSPTLEMEVSESQGSCYKMRILVLQRPNYLYNDLKKLSIQSKKLKEKLEKIKLCMNQPILLNQIESPIFSKTSRVVLGYIGSDA